MLFNFKVINFTPNLTSSIIQGLDFAFKSLSLRLKLLFSNYHQKFFSALLKILQEYLLLFVLVFISQDPLLFAFKLNLFANGKILFISLVNMTD